MSFTATFYQFPKKENSTAQPTISTPKVDYDIVLKGQCSILAPTIALQVALSTAPDQYNYCYIGSFNRYYFVKDWIFDNRLWIASLSCDVLASYKYFIGSSYEYVTRSASDYDGSITDNLYPVTSTYSTAYSAITNPNQLNILTGMSGGSFIIGLMNGDSNAIGGISYYAMSLGQMQNLREFMLGNSNAGTSDLADILQNDITDLSPGVVKALFNPFQYIASCIWFPYDYSTEATWTQVSNIQFGYWQLANISARRVPANQVVQLFTATATPSVHPQSATRGEYLNCAPYTENVIYLPPFGTIPLDGVLIKDVTNIQLYWWVDVTTGQATLDIKGSKADMSLVQLAAPQVAQVGVPVTLSAIGTNYQGNQFSTIAIGAELLGDAIMNNGKGVSLAEAQSKMLSASNAEEMLEVAGTRINVRSALTTGNPLLQQSAMGARVENKVTTAITGIGNVTKALCTGVQTLGGNGSFSNLILDAFLFQLFYHVCDDDNSHRGRPLCQVKLLNTLSGYIQVADPSFSLSNCTDTERALIKQHMASGFYME